MEWVAWVRKGIIAVTAGLGQLALVVTPISDAGEHVTTAEWIAVALAALGALGVALVPNGPDPRGRHEA